MQLGFFLLPVYICTDHRKVTHDILHATGFFCFASSDKMDKQVLTSTTTGDKSGRYAVGIFKDGRFPMFIEKMIHMRYY